MDEIFRVLKDNGTVWINLGDSYSAAHTGGRRSDKSTLSDATGEAQERKQVKITKEVDKCLLLIPHRFGIGCQTPKYILRDDLTNEEKEYVFKELLNAEK